MAFKTNNNLNVILFYLFSPYFTEPYLNKNILLRKPTHNSSALSSTALYDSRLAVDGDRNRNFWAGSCFHAVAETSAQYYIIVDMLYSYKVDHVVVWSRDANAARLDYFLIGLTSINYFMKTTTVARGSYPLCGQYPYVTQVSNKLSTLKSASRFVRLKLSQWLNPQFLNAYGSRTHACN
ncbi:hypothetical protein HELRODRAFT_177433 [Helobdella robusta]|uniref:Uncharacterized protein n=1 Tax=Helobdella robusta TaxID=6412 RepID=T1FBP4_HELRO|nr:hypothetical protein HELRODRAFT_177433 [Helobdella robusta]ESN98185.1 hypothetical protein HELRODRAFT_177433 [Helobdella robusta]